MPLSETSHPESSNGMRNQLHIETKVAIFGAQLQIIESTHWQVMEDGQELINRREFREAFHLKGNLWLPGPRLKYAKGSIEIIVGAAGNETYKPDRRTLQPLNAKMGDKTSLVWNFLIQQHGKPEIDGLLSRLYQALDGFTAPTPVVWDELQNQPVSELPSVPASVVVNYFDRRAPCIWTSLFGWS